VSLSFATPALLFGTLFALVPLIIHLIYRSRITVIRFSSLRFIRLSHDENARRFRLREILLLLARMAVIFLLASAAAGPVLKKAGEPLSGTDKHRKIVIILDNSLSMGYLRNAVTVFDEGLRRAKEVLSAVYERGDTIAVVPAADTAGLVYSEVYSLEAAYKKLSAVRLSRKKADIPDSLRLCRGTYSPVQSRDTSVYIFSDFHVSDYTDQAAAPPAGGPNHTVLIDLNPGDFFNTAVQDVQPPVVYPAQGSDVLYRMTIRNFGNIAGRSSAEMFINGRKVFQRDLSFAPGELKTLDIPGGGYGLSQGVKAGKVTIDGDNLKLDNEFYFLDQSPAKTRIAVVDDSDGFSASYYFVKAFEAWENNPVVTYKVVRSPDLPAELQTADLVFLTSFRNMTPAAAESLKAWFEKGGTMFACFENDLDITFFNQYFTGLRLAPFRVLNKVLMPTDRTNDSFGVKEVDLTHGFLSFFRDYNFFPTVRVRGYYKTDFDLADARLDILAKYNSRSAALMEYAYINEKEKESGKALYFTSSISPALSDLAFHPNFPPFVFQMIRYLTFKKFRMFTTGVQKSSVMASLGLGSGANVEKNISDAYSYVPFNGNTFDDPGIYRSGKEYFTVAPPGGESDLTPASDAALKKVLGSYSRYASGSGLAAKLGTEGKGRSLSGLLIFLAILMLVFEMFLANKLLKTTRSRTVHEPA
jgi:hypothetical protein